MKELQSIKDHNRAILASIVTSDTDGPDQSVEAIIKSTMVLPPDLIQAMAPIIYKIGNINYTGDLESFCTIVWTDLNLSQKGYNIFKVTLNLVW